MRARDPDHSTGPRLTAIRALYVTYNMALGLSLPYLAPFLETRGISGSVQGRLFALRTAAAIASQPVIGLIADRFGIGRAIRGACVTGFLAIALLFLAQGANAFAGVFVLLALGNSSTSVLLDAAAIAELESAHGAGGAFSFAHTRIFGSAAFAASALGFGLIFAGAASAVTAPWAVRAMLAFTAGSVVVSFFTPPRSGAVSRPGVRDLGRLLRCPGVPQILVAAALQWIAMTPYNLFFGAHVQHHGGDSTTIGLSISCAILGEMIVMATAPRWLERFSPRRVLAVSAAVGIARWTATGLGAPWLVVPMQALHAFSFAAFYLSMTDAMVRRTPPELRGSAQSLLNAGGASLGSLIGGLAAGPLYEIDHGRTLFVAAGAFSVLPMLAALAIPPLPSTRP